MPNIWVTIEKHFLASQISLFQLHIMPPLGYIHMAPLTIHVQTSIPRGLIIARHNQAVHLITQTLQANPHTHFYMLINARNLNNTNKKTQSHNGLSNVDAHNQPAHAKRN